MKLRFFIYALLLLVSANSLMAQEVEITKINCTYINAQFTGSFCTNCYLYPCGPQMSNYFELQEKQGSNWVTINTKYGFNHNFYLVSGKTYRVVAKYVVNSGCITTTCWWGQTATWCLGVRGTKISREYYAADPVADGHIVDGSQVPLNGCIPYVANQSVWLDASACVGENEYQVQINRTLPSPAWNSNGWQSGSAGLVDLREVWRTNHSSWDLWPGTYNVNLAVRNDCSGWEDIDLYLRIGEPGDPDCRIGKFETQFDVLLYPNPVADELKLDWAEPIEDDVEYFVQDFSGKMVMRGTLTSSGESINTRSLPNGMYAINFVTKDNKIAKKFLVSR
jgi:hypothetical protein